MYENLVNLYTLGILLNKNTKVLCMDGDVILEGEIPEKSYYNEFLKFGNRFEVARDRGDIIKFIRRAYDFYLDAKKNTRNEQLIIIIRNFQYIDLLKNILKGDKIKESDYIEGETEKEEETTMNPTSFFEFGSSSSSSEESVSGKLVKLIDDGS